MNPVSLTLFCAAIITTAVLLLSVLYPLERNRVIETLFDYLESGGTKREFVRVERRTTGRPRYYLPVPEMRLSRDEKLRRMDARFAAARKRAS
jgi:hypothetical protein